MTLQLKTPLALQWNGDFDTSDYQNFLGGILDLAEEGNFSAIRAKFGECKILGEYSAVPIPTNRELFTSADALRRAVGIGTTTTHHLSQDKKSGQVCHSALQRIENGKIRVIAPKIMPFIFFGPDNEYLLTAPGPNGIIISGPESLKWFHEPIPDNLLENGRAKTLFSFEMERAGCSREQIEKAVAAMDTAMRTNPNLYRRTDALTL